MKSSCVNAIGLMFVAFAPCAVEGMAMTHLWPESMTHDHTSVLLETTGINGLPSKKRIAVIFRGQTFREAYKVGDEEHRRSCVQGGIEMQLRCTNSIVENVIKPLEQKDNKVKVFLTTPFATRSRLPVLHKRDMASEESVVGSCPLDDLIVRALTVNSSRVLRRKQGIESSGQSDAMLKVMGYFDHECGGIEQVKTQFDYIIIVRNDLLWYKPIDQIRFDIDNMNVETRCEEETKPVIGGMACIHDIIWMMPTKFYAAFRATIGHDGCFDPDVPPEHQHGHACQMAMRSALKELGAERAFGWLEPERRRLHKHSEIADLAIGTAD